MTIAPTTVTLIHLVEDEAGRTTRIARSYAAEDVTDEMVEEADDIELID